MAKKVSTDTTKTRMGDFYQYLIALEKCLEANEGDIVYIESMGDVASGESSIEIKYHESDSYTMSDRHIDFWKTLNNMVKNYEELKDYKNLILHTTSSITQGSRLIDWNDLNKFQKYTVIEKIKNEKTTDTIANFCNTIFSFNSSYTLENLHNVLDRFYISCNNLNMDNKINQILQKEFFKSYPLKNRRNFMELLLSYIYGKMIRGSKYWEIDITEFLDFSRLNASRYTQDKISITNIFKKEEIEHSIYSNHVFVEEIKKINFDRKIVEAINDYCRTKNTVIHQSKYDWTFIDVLTELKEDLHFSLKTKKENHELEMNDQDFLRASQKCYNYSISMPLKVIRGYENMEDFFQRGMIHSIVNENKKYNFTWLITPNDDN